ncbi:MAG: alpha/beta hydrolase [Actinomycetia bacterium]|nr:alpha/beta hydrolase [Actinomycetes bacterium]
MRDLTSCVIDVMDALDLPTAHLLGNHTGATVQAEIAAEWPERVGRLVLFGYALVTTEAERRTELEVRVEELDRSLEPAPDGAHLIRWWTWFRMQTILMRWGANAVPSEPLSPSEAGFMAAGMRDIVRSSKAFVPVYRAVFEYDSAARLPLILAPTLVIDGTGPFEPETVRRSADVARLIPECEAMTMDGEDGNIVWWRLEVLADAVREFLDRNP